MRFAIAAVVLPLLVPLAGCSDCNDNYLIDGHRDVTADAQYQDAQTTWTSTQTAAVATSSIRFNGDRQATTPQDLVLSRTDSFVAAFVTNPATTRPIEFELTVRAVSPASAEIDLDDENAALLFRPLESTTATAAHDLQGHISIAALSQNCAAPGSPAACLLQAHGTFALSATIGDDLGTLTVESATFDAQDSWYHDTQACEERLGN